MKNVFILAVLALMLASCGNYRKIQKDYLLFQKGLDSLPKPEYKPLKIEARDNLNILFYTESTRSPEQIALYNNASEGRGGRVTVDEQGFIELPSIGKVKVVGLTCKQLADTLTQRIKPYIKSPGVYVKLEGIKINVMGEVSSPGIKNFPDERMTLLDAIAQAGAFSDFSTRNDVLVIREDSGVRKSYVVNFQDAQNLYSSPVFQLKQNDLVFVRPSDFKYKTLNAQNLQQTIQPFTSYASIASFSISIILLVTSLFKK
jgi:polysaccharide export outer membrane protein